MSTDTQLPTRARRARRVASVRTVGAWELVHRLGEGRFTEVFQARPDGETTTAADYVLKLLKPDCQHDPLALRLLQREAFVAGEVSHPHLASVLAAHVDGPPYYLVAPYLVGATLESAIGYASRLPIPHALWLARQTAEALDGLHSAGWIHGDVKPANILVARNGHVTLLDLGFARRIERRASDRELLATTMAYAPPESFHENLPLTGRSDVYSLGVTLYEALTGMLPFTCNDPTDLAAAHLASPPPDARRVAPQLPNRIGRLLKKMLAKEPLRRPSAEELVSWLADLEIENFASRVAA